MACFHEMNEGYDKDLKSNNFLKNRYNLFKFADNFTDIHKIRKIIYLSWLLKCWVPYVRIYYKHLKKKIFFLFIFKKIKIWSYKNNSYQNEAFVIIAITKRHFNTYSCLVQLLEAGTLWWATGLSARRFDSEVVSWSLCHKRACPNPTVSQNIFYFVQTCKKIMNCINKSTCSHIFCIVLRQLAPKKNFHHNVSLHFHDLNEKQV